MAACSDMQLQSSRTESTMQNEITQISCSYCILTADNCSRQGVTQYFGLLIISIRPTSADNTEYRQSPKNFQANALPGPKLLTAQWVSNPKDRKSVV